MWKTEARTIESGILETLAWFSLFSYAPTALELWRFAFISCPFGELLSALTHLVQRSVLIEGNGRFTMFGQRAMLHEHELRYRASLPKLEQAKRVAERLARFADVRAVFACNSLSLLHARESSDIDFFVVARRGAIWRTRFVAVAPTALFGKRPTAKDERDASCFSFFVTDDALDLRKHALPDADPYLAFWIASLLPLHDPDGMFTRILSESGIYTLFPQSSQFPVLPRGAAQGTWRLPASLEMPLRILQMQRFPEAIRSRIGRGTQVVVSDRALKFHTLDRRVEYRQAFAERLHALGI